MPTDQRRPAGSRFLADTLMSMSILGAITAITYLARGEAVPLAVVVLIHCSVTFVHGRAMRRELASASLSETH